MPLQKPEQQRRGCCFILLPSSLQFTLPPLASNDLLDAAPVECVFQPSQLKYKVTSEMLSMRPWHIMFTQRFLLVTR